MDEDSESVSATTNVESNITLDSPSPAITNVAASDGPLNDDATNIAAGVGPLDDDTTNVDDSLIYNLSTVDDSVMFDDDSEEDRSILHDRLVFDKNSKVRYIQGSKTLQSPRTPYARTRSLQRARSLSIIFFTWI